MSANSYWSVGDWWRVVYGSDRTCEWTGNVETDRKGQYVGMLDVGQWDVLVGCIEGLAMEQLQSHYDDARHDARHLVLTVHRGDRSKTVDDYNNAGPPVMREAETILLGMANRVAWQERPR